MGISKKLAASAIVAVSIAGAGAVAWAQDGGSTPSQSAPSQTAPGQTAPAQTPPARAGRRAGLLGRVEHGDLIVRTKNGFQPMTVDRGRVTAASATSLTVLRPDGTSVTVTLDSATKFRGVASAADLVTGKAAVVFSHDGHALVVGQPRKHGGAPSTNSTNQG